MGLVVARTPPPALAGGTHMADSSSQNGTRGGLNRRAFMRLAPLGAVGLGALWAAACQPTSAGPRPTSGQPAAAPGAPTVAAGGKPGAYPVSVPDTFSP